MKILVLQLARLGDIYSLWPGLHALKRSQPQAEISLVVRPRFKAATQGLECVDRVIELPSEAILSPLLAEPVDISTALHAVNGFLEDLRNSQYDFIVNASFSPASSYLTKILSEDGAQVLGYTRHHDGSLRLPDELSVYFYSQVGPGRANRLHLADLFAHLLGVELIDEDWCHPVCSYSGQKSKSIVIHTGTSEGHKTVSPQTWQNLCSRLGKSGYRLTLVGSGQERELCQWIGQSDLQVENLAGQTSLGELFEVISQSRLLIGGDSAPVHMASLTGTPCLQVSVGRVSFWETGPRSPGSRVIRLSDGRCPQPELIHQEVQSMIQGEKPGTSTYILGRGEPVFYREGENLRDSFRWNLVRALYMQGTYPIADQMETVDAMTKLAEVNDLILENYARIDTLRDYQELNEILNRLDEVILALGRIEPSIDPLINWYQVRKIMIPPGKFSEVLQATELIHRDLEKIVHIYRADKSALMEGDLK